jgi:mono/diheme cytochrome c family protein
MKFRLPLMLVLGLLLSQAPSQAAAPIDPERVAHGKYLFDGADCAACHASDKNSAVMSGGLGLDTPFGRFRAPNITPDSDFGIGSWSQSDFARAVRDGRGKHGEYLYPVFPYPSFTRMSDSDIADIYAYLMTQPAVHEANLPHQLKFPFGMRSLMLGWRTLFFTPGAMQTDASHDADWNRGNYLVHAVAHCEECHTPRNALGALKKTMALSGNIGGPDGQNAPNITSDVDNGIGSWSIADIQRLLKSGMTPDSDQVGSGMKAVVRATSKLSDDDRHAIAVYLKTVKAIHVDLPATPAGTSTAKH